MIALGYSEAVNMSFMSPEDLNLFEIPENDVRRKYISLMNPLRQEESIMRTMIMPGLLRNIEKNSSRGIEALKLFEIGRVFIKNNNSVLPEEPVHLGIISKKEDFKSPFGEDLYDFYALKGVINGFIRHLKIQTVEYKRSPEPFLHIGQSADIYIDSEKIGYIGVVSPKLLTAFDFKTKPYICMAEIDLDRLFNLYISIKLTYYKPFSTYPPVKRDTALLVSEDYEIKKILDLIKSYNNELIEDVYIFDVYKGSGIPKDKKSIAFRVTYRAFEKTLTSEEVDLIHSKLVEQIISETGAELRF
jgi:phenylalanyl-tRNA synthetase beta chain